MGGLFWYDYVPCQSDGGESMSSVETALLSMVRASAASKLQMAMNKKQKRAYVAIVSDYFKEIIVPRALRAMAKGARPSPHLLLECVKVSLSSLDTVHVDVQRLEEILAERS